VRIDGELMEIWPNKVCDNRIQRKSRRTSQVADIINNTIADAETGTLLAGEGYHMDIAT